MPEAYTHIRIALRAREELKSAGVEPGKCNPRCLRKLYLATLQGFQRQVTQLVEQAHNSLVEQEQAVVGWSVGQAGPWHGKGSL